MSYIKIINYIFKTKDLSYNYFKDNSYQIYESGNPYGHVKEFIRLNKKIRYDAHRVISKKALILNLYNIEIGSATDINGNIYYFDVFEDGYYRIFRINNYKENIMEVANEKYIKTNS